MAKRDRAEHVVPGASREFPGGECRRQGAAAA
jgi:hypothetical protein